jgi:sec-independent protein translocase protein TatC
MSVGFFFACAVMVPLFIFHLYTFFKPGLLKKERRIFFLSLPISLGLFILGFSYSAGMLYYAIQFIAKINISLGIVNYWDIRLFISEIVITSSLLGVLFIFPLFITILIRLGFLNVNFLKSKRRHAIAIIFIIVSLLPPTDGISLILMAAPLMLMFELTILLNRNKHKGRNLILTQ